MNQKIIIGARASPLSLAQAKEVSALLKEKFPQHSFSLKKIVTSGDKSRTSLRDITLPREVRDKHLNRQRNDTGIFVKEIEEALLTGKIDLAVHSLKDLPCALPEGLELAAVTKRLNPCDCIIFKDKKTSLSKLKKGARIGTSSLRRKAQLLYWRADLQVENLRGNLDTRLKKLVEDKFDAIVIAMAGVIRLGAVAADFFIQPIPASFILPAPGQGALAIEVRARDKLIEALAQRINSQESFLCVSCERAFLRELGGGCRLPLGALAEIKDGKIHLEAVVASPDGKRLVRLNKRASLDKPEVLGKQLAHQMLKKGARKLFKGLNLVDLVGRQGLLTKHEK